MTRLATSASLKPIHENVERIDAPCDEFDSRASQSGSIAATTWQPEYDCVDLASEDSFPASDAPSWTGVTGFGLPYRAES